MTHVMLMSTNSIYPPHWKGRVKKPQKKKYQRCRNLQDAAITDENDETHQPNESVKSKIKGVIQVMALTEEPEAQKSKLG